jgi:photosystem II stability/assembly factor-like uncharacterized protein
MKQKLLQTGFYFFAAIQLNAQAFWQALPAMINNSNASVNDISAPNLNTCWAIGAVFDPGSGVCALPFNQYTRTGNGGISFKSGIINIPSMYGPSSICAIDSNTAWITCTDMFSGADGRVYKTINGGTVWNKQNTAIFDGSANFVHFYDANIGFAIGDSLIYRTTDGGANWIVNTDLVSLFQYRQSYMYNAFETKGNHVWVGTNYGRMFYSNDKGITWTASATQIPYGFKSIAFKDSLNGVAVVNKWQSGANGGGGFIDDAYLYVTHDGGNTWAQQYMNLPGSFIYKNYATKYAIAYVPGTASTFIMTSEINNNNFTAKTNDYGVSWDILDSVDRTTDIVFVDSNTAYCGTYFSTANTGILKWNKKTSPNAIINNKVNNSAVYPNPLMNNSCIINLKNTYNTIICSVSDIDGKIVFINEFKNCNTINLQLPKTLNAGYYQLSLKKNLETEIIKLIIQ